MTNGDLINIFMERGCLHHQAEFAAKFFDKVPARLHLLISPPGSGKSATITTIIRHSISSCNSRRILLLTSSMDLAGQWEYLLKEAGLALPIEILDKRRFRDLEFSKPSEESPLLETGIVIMTPHLARQKDVAAALGSVPWDLLVVDEVDRLHRRSQIGELVEHLLIQSGGLRAILLSSFGRWHDEQLSLLFKRFKGIVETRWSYQDMRGRDGGPLIPEIHIEWISYRRSNVEVQFLEDLEKALREFISRNQAIRFIALNILKSASSSLFALGQRLRRLRQRRNEVVHGLYRSDSQGSLFENTEEPDLEGSNEMVKLRALAKLSDVVTPFIGAVEELPTDSKFDALQRVLEEIISPETAEKSICIVTDFVDTANFLASALRERLDNLALIAGQQTFHDREKKIERFRNDGGVIIATRHAVTSHISAKNVIFYDSPVRREVLEEQIGYFMRANEFKSVRILGLTDTSDVLDFERLALSSPDAMDADSTLSTDSLYEI